VTDAIQTMLLYFILPLWLLAGIADWLCHRAARIEISAGPRESLIHLLMFGEMAVPFLAGLLLDIDAMVILVMILAFLVHEVTALWDVNFATRYREVSPIEQHVHSFLELVPLMALLMVCLLHWGQFLALFGAGDESARFSLTWKEPPLPTSYLVVVLAAALLTEILPYLEELLRGLRAGSRRAIFKPISPP